MELTIFLLCSQNKQNADFLKILHKYTPIHLIYSKSNIVNTSAFHIMINLFRILTLKISHFQMKFKVTIKLTIKTVK